MKAINKAVRLKLLHNPNFSTTNREGWVCAVVTLEDNKGKPYLAYKDKLGVTWPIDLDLYRMDYA